MHGVKNIKTLNFLARLRIFTVISMKQRLLGSATVQSSINPPPPRQKRSVQNKITLSFPTFETQTVNSSKALVNFYQTVWRHISPFKFYQNMTLVLEGWVSGYKET